jgi:hypothetical protein
MRRRRIAVLLVIAAALTLGWSLYLAAQPRELWEMHELLALSAIDQQQPGFFRKLLKLREPNMGQLLRDWESEHGKDPRYWQLRKFYHLFGTNTRSGYDSDNQEFLAVIDRGIYDAASFELVPIQVVEDKSGELGVLDFFDKAIASDKDNGWYYYRKADYLISLGEIEDARVLLRQGNAAPRCNTPVPFPESEAWKLIGKARSRASKILVGYTLAGENSRLPNYIKIKDQYKNACVAFALGYPLEFGDELLTRARRMGQGERENAMSVLVAAVLARVILGWVNDEALDLTPAQTKELETIYADLDKPKALIKESVAAVESELGVVPKATASGSSKRYAPNRRDYVRYYEGLVLELKYQPKLAPYFDCLDPPPLALWEAGKLQGESRPATPAAK